MTDWLQRVRDLEPARVRAVWTAVVALLVAVGVTVNTDVDGAVQALIVAVFTLLPLIQGEATRAKVTPGAKTDADADAAAEAEWLAEDDGDEFIGLGE